MHRQKEMVLCQDPSVKEKFSRDILLKANEIIYLGDTSIKYFDKKFPVKAFTVKTKFKIQRYNGSIVPSKLPGFDKFNFEYRVYLYDHLDRLFQKEVDRINEENCSNYNQPKFEVSSKGYLKVIHGSNDNHENFLHYFYSTPYAVLIFEYSEEKMDSMNPTEGQAYLGFPFWAVAVNCTSPSIFMSVHEIQE